MFSFHNASPELEKKQFFIGKDLIFSEPKEVLGFMQTYLSYGLFLSLTCKYSQGSFLKKINDLFLKKQGVLSTVSPKKSRGKSGDNTASFCGPT